jgi:DNA-binding transcriptional MocR family regulator
MDRPPPWTFLTNHAHVLLCLVAQPDIRMRDIAQKIGLTERWVQQIIRELAAAGYISRRRNGRRNEYLVHPQLPLRHPLEAHRRVQDMLELVQLPPAERTPDPGADDADDSDDAALPSPAGERNAHV